MAKKKPTATDIIEVNRGNLLKVFKTFVEHREPGGLCIGVVLKADRPIDVHIRLDEGDEFRIDVPITLHGDKP
ncbi:MAG: hypothetical protein AB7Q00_14775 [Phycisphaerales bacterium]